MGVICWSCALVWDKDKPKLLPIKVDDVSTFVFFLEAQLSYSAHCLMDVQVSVVLSCKSDRCDHAPGILGKCHHGKEAAGPFLFFFPRDFLGISLFPIGGLPCDFSGTLRNFSWMMSRCSLVALPAPVIFGAETPVAGARGCCKQAFGQS